MGNAQIPVGGVGQGLRICHREGLVVHEVVVDAPERFRYMLAHELPQAAAHHRQRPLNPAPVHAKAEHVAFMLSKSEVKTQAR